MKVKICSYPCCTHYAVDGTTRCERHQLPKREFPKTGWLSDSQKVFYNSARWKKERAEFFKANPECAICGAPATDVHHAWPDGYDYWNAEDFFNQDHWVPLCSDCHDRISKEAMTRRRHGGRRKKEGGLTS